MNVNHFFSIGSAHLALGTPCEDYALSGELPDGTVYGAVADGCSGAHANTDVGARALAWAFKQALAQRQTASGQWFGEGFQPLLQGAFNAHQYTGERSDYLTTLVGFAATPDYASVYAHGDGAIALRYADGRQQLIELSWQGNMPFYLAYQEHPDLMASFLAAHARSLVRPLRQRTTTFTSVASEVTLLDCTDVYFGIPEVLGGHVLHFEPRREGILALAVLTDGVEQVSALTPVAVANEFLAFKNFQGDFVKRRLLRALKTFNQVQMAPRDDVGIAAVWFPDTE